MKSKVDSVIFWIIRFILLFAPIAYGSVSAAHLSIILLLVFIICLAWLFDTWRNAELRFNDSPLQLPILGLILIGALQMLPIGYVKFESLPVNAVYSLSYDPYQTRLAVVRLCIFLIFFAAILTFVRDQRKVKTIAFLVVVLGAVFGFLGILQQLTDPQTIFGIRTVRDAIPFGTFVNRHHFASFMMMSVALAFGIVYGGNIPSDEKLLIWIPIIIMILAIIMTGSRGGLLSLLVTLIFILIVTRMHIRKEDDVLISKFGLSLPLLGLLLVFIVLGLVFFIGADQWLARSLGLQIQEDVSGGRFHFWYIAWRIFLDHPILGTGLDSFATMFQQYDTWNGRFRVERAHNEYLQTLSDSGIIGFACVSAFIYLLFKRGLRLISCERDYLFRGIAIGALAGCLGVLIHSFFDFPLRTNSNAFYFLLLAALASEPVEHSSRMEISGGH